MRLAQVRCKFPCKKSKILSPLSYAACFFPGLSAAPSAKATSRGRARSIFAEPTTQNPPAITRPLPKLYQRWYIIICAFEPPRCQSPRPTSGGLWLSLSAAATAGVTAIGPGTSSLSPGPGSDSGAAPSPNPSPGPGPALSFRRAVEQAVRALDELFEIGTVGRRDRDHPVVASRALQRG